MTVLTGMAKPRPTLPALPDCRVAELGEYIAELMPMICRCMLIRAPPELPGLSEASVWMALYVVVDEPVSPLYWLPPNSNGQPPPPCRPGPACLALVPRSLGTVTSRSSAETMPLVTVPVRPSGEPIATTSSPTLTLSESPSVAGLQAARRRAP